MTKNHEDGPEDIKHLQNVLDRVKVSTILGNPWPGNVRALMNVIKRAAVLAEDIFEPSHIPLELQGDAGVLVNRQREDERKPLDERLAEIEKEMIIKAIMQAGGIQARAANLLGINQRRLWYRVKKLGIDPDSLKGLHNL